MHQVVLLTANYGIERVKETPGGCCCCCSTMLITGDVNLVIVQDICCTCCVRFHYRTGGDATYHSGTDSGSDRFSVCADDPVVSTKLVIICYNHNLSWKVHLKLMKVMNVCNVL